MLLAAEALRVDFEDVLGARRTRGEPAVVRDDLQTAYLRAIPRCSRQPRADGLTAQRVRPHRLWRQLLQHRLLLRRRRSVDARVVRRAEATHDRLRLLARILPGSREDLGGE